MTTQNTSKNTFLYVAIGLVAALVVASIVMGAVLLYKLNDSSEEEKKKEYLKEQVQRSNEEAEVESQEPSIKQPVAVNQPAVDVSMLTTAWVKDEDGYTNVRSGKGTQYPVVGQVTDGSTILVHPDDFTQGWMRLYNADGTFYGYMSRKKIVKSSTGVSPDLEYVFVIDEDGYTNVRSGKGTQYSIVGKVQDGTPILVNSKDKSQGWMRVYHDNGEFWGYMSRKKIEL